MLDTIYEDIRERTGGDIYIGVVGPVRTGKSTFIHRFLDQLVMPSILNEHDRDRTQDQIPQSATGKTVMTTEPKFIPDEAVRIRVGEGTELNVKLIDCVGYMVEGALGGEEDGRQRMVMTPWSEEPMPFAEAGEIGTGRVISEHSTVGMLVTTDGSITDIPRESYIEAEERAVKELKECGKPFALLLNSRNPDSPEAHRLAEELEEKYGVPVALISAPELNCEDIKQILSLVLGEFPIKQLRFKLPSWTVALDSEHSLIKELYGRIDRFSEKCSRLSDVGRQCHEEDVELVSLDAGDGKGELYLPLQDNVYYDTLSAMTGLDLKDKEAVFTSLIGLSQTEKKYERVRSALEEAASTGYGIVMPNAEQMTLDEPSVIKQSGGYGVKVSARGEALHLIKTSINAELCPLVGTEEQSLAVVKYLSEELKSPEEVWESNMFGKSLYSLVSDGMNAKLNHLPPESRERLGVTLERIVNEGAGGLICILL